VINGTVRGTALEKDRHGTMEVGGSAVLFNDSMWKKGPTEQGREGKSEPWGDLGNKEMSPPLKVFAAPSSLTFFQRFWSRGEGAGGQTRHEGVKC